MQHTISLKFEKETKNTLKFEEVPATGKPPIIGCMYVQKWALSSKPATLEVIINAPDGNVASD